MPQSLSRIYIHLVFSQELHPRLNYGRTFGALRTAFTLMPPSLFHLILLLLMAVFVFTARGQGINESLRSELLAMEKVDQDVRAKCASLTVAEEQGKCLGEAMTSI